MKNSNSTYRSHPLNSKFVYQNIQPDNTYDMQRTSLDHNNTPLTKQLAVLKDNALTNEPTKEQLVAVLNMIKDKSWNSHSPDNKRAYTYAVQSALDYLGYNQVGVRDGVLGVNTMKAVEAFQKDTLNKSYVNAVVDGKIGPRTIDALITELGKLDPGVAMSTPANTTGAPAVSSNNVPGAITDATNIANTAQIDKKTPLEMPLKSTVEQIKKGTDKPKINVVAAKEQNNAAVLSDLRNDMHDRVHQNRFNTYVPRLLDAYLKDQNDAQKYVDNYLLINNADAQIVSLQEQVTKREEELVEAGKEIKSSKQDRKAIRKNKIEDRTARTANIKQENIDISVSREAKRDANNAIETLKIKIGEVEIQKEAAKEAMQKYERTHGVTLKVALDSTPKEITDDSGNTIPNRDYNKEIQARLEAHVPHPQMIVKGMNNAVLFDSNMSNDKAFDDMYKTNNPKFIEMAMAMKLNELAHNNPDIVYDYVKPAVGAGQVNTFIIRGKDEAPYKAPVVEEEVNNNKSNTSNGNNEEEQSQNTIPEEENNIIDNVNNKGLKDILQDAAWNIDSIKHALMDINKEYEIDYDSKENVFLIDNKIALSYDTTSGNYRTIDLMNNKALLQYQQGQVVEGTKGDFKSFIEQSLEQQKVNDLGKAMNEVENILYKSS